MKKNLSLKFTDESSVTFQSSVSGPGEFGPCLTLFWTNVFATQIGDLFLENVDYQAL